MNQKDGLLAQTKLLNQPVSSLKVTKKSPITITERAAKQIKILLAKRGQDSLGIRVGVKSGGCSGLSYYIEYADVAHKFDEIIEDKGVRIIIDAKALMYLISSEMDYMQEQFKSGFVFNNPNEKGKCGCGKSFNT